MWDDARVYQNNGRCAMKAYAPLGGLGPQENAVSHVVKVFEHVNESVSMDLLVSAKDASEIAERTKTVMPVNVRVGQSGLDGLHAQEHVDRVRNHAPESVNSA